MKRKQPKQGKRRNDRKECPRLKKFISDISQFNEDHKTECEVIESHGKSYDLQRKQRGPTRKERRKEERKLKKMRKEAFMQRKPIPTKQSLEEAKQKAVDVAKKKKLRSRKKKENKERKKRKERQQKEKEEAHQQELKDANKAENRAIKQLERQLKLNKRKSKSIPLSFKNDGLDYLLEVIDNDYGKHTHDTEGDSDEDLPKTSWDLEEDLEDVDDDDDEEGEEEEEDSDGQTSSDEESAQPDGGEDQDYEELTSEEDHNMEETQKVKSNTKKVRFADEVTKQPKQKRSKKSKSASVQADEGVSEAGHEGDDITPETVPQEVPAREDIYGRPTDTHGKLVSVTGAYVPPSKRLQLAAGGDTDNQLEHDRMRKQLKGLLNRLSEANLQSISNDIEALYRSHSRMSVTGVLCTLVLEACVSVQPSPPRLIMEHILLVAVLHVNVGMEVGAHLLETVTRRLDALFTSSDYSETHEMDNLLTVMSNLYNFKVVESVLVLDILRKLVETFTEKDIQMILLMLKNVGPSLRKEDPATLKDVILLIQSKAATADTSKATDQSRVRFMLEVLLAIKNNNMRKIPNYDPSHMEHLSKLLKNYAHSGTSADTVLRVSFSDLLEADSRGRWWLVGSAWTGPQGQPSGAEAAGVSSDNAIPVSGEMGAQILHLAKQQRMNTNIRKNIFCIIMTSEDFVDAFEKLLHMGLKHQQEREIIHVIMDLCLQEKSFNPFYALLAQKFCEYDRRFQMTVQFSLWDKFKILEELGQVRSHNLAGLLSHLLVAKAISMSIFKVIEFGELDKARVRFIKKILRNLLMDQPDHVMCEVFSRISAVPKLHVLREGLKLFMRHFILRDKNNVLTGTQDIMKQKVEMAEKSLSASDTKMML